MKIVRIAVSSVIAAAALVGLAAVPADAAPKTLVSGVYVTPAGRAESILPSYVPVASPGKYKTTGRPKNKACSLRAVDDYGNTVAGMYLVKASSATLVIPAGAAIVEVSGPCKWKRV